MRNGSPRRDHVAKHISVLALIQCQEFPSRAEILPLFLRASPPRSNCNRHRYKQILMMDTDLHSPDPLATDLFRPAKRRRFYRKRTDADNDDDTSDCPTQSPSAAPPELQTVDELISNAGDISRNEDQGQEDISALSVPELVRRRKAIQRRKGGIEFTNPTPSLSTSNGLDPGEDLGIEEDEVPANIKSVIERFAPQTGQVTASTDKHMYVPSSR